MTDQPETFEVNEMEHDIGDRECGSYWQAYPVDCVCGGLIHANFGDYTADYDYYLVVLCDSCGDEYEEKE